MAADPSDPLEAQIERIRASGWLGRSQSLARLFDYLADAARSGRAIRETDVAHDVFDRLDDLSGDASVRVYIHRLRRKLTDYYAGPGAGEPFRLTIPRGDYRLHLEGETNEQPAAEIESPPRRRFAVFALAAFLAVNLFGWALAGYLRQSDRQVAAAVRTPLWSVIGRDRPVLVVVGDYYIFGETGANSIEVERMIRDFAINGRDDLDTFLMEHPDKQGRYVDIDTTYTPTGATLALRSILPVVRAAAGAPDRLQIVTSSQLRPDMLKTADIVYVGYLSALRLLERPVFARARLQIGNSYDELVDSRTRRTFTSAAGGATSEQPNRDFGYVRLLPGPAGNHILVIAGTRDIGVEQSAEAAADPGTAKAIRPDARGDIEQLFEVRGIGRTFLGASPVRL